MKKYIYKYPVSLTNITELTFNGYYHIVRVAYQRDELYAWIEITEVKDVTHVLQLQVFGTGHAIQVGYGHVASVESPNGAFVWHIYAEHG